MASAPARPATVRRSKAGLVGAIVALLVVIALAGLVVWAVLVAGSRRQPVEAPPFERFKPAWSSAMRKAGVEATFPAAPTDITTLQVTGSTPFEATFTAEEITALMNVYTFTSDVGGQLVSVSSAQAEFPAPGVGVLSGTLSAGGGSYGARIEGPLGYSATGIDSPGATTLEVDGFTISGERRRQASDAVVAYLNLYVRAAPGLIIEQARIVEGGIAVKGSAPQRIE